MDERNGKAGRDAAGRFSKGNAGGPGRPRRGPERDYLNALAEVVTVKDWQDVVRKALADAKAGCGVARRWLSDQLLGPNPLMNQELLDAYVRVEEQLTEQNRLKQELLSQTRNAPPPAPPCTDPLDPNYVPDPIDRFCVAGPNDEPFEQYWAKEREKLRNGQAAPDLGDTLTDAPPPHRYPGDDEIDRILNG
jgi:hypothetical protein